MTTEIAALRKKTREEIERLCPEMRGIVATDVVDGKEVATYETRAINLEDCLFAVNRSLRQTWRGGMWTFLLFKHWEYGRSYDDQSEDFIRLLSSYLGI